MIAGGILAGVSDDGRALVGFEDFVAGKTNGVWELGKIFSADDIKDNFRLVFDEGEARALLNEARTALLNGEN